MKKWGPLYYLSIIVIGVAIAIETLPKDDHEYYDDYEKEINVMKRWNGKYFKIKNE